MERSRSRSGARLKQLRRDPKLHALDARLFHGKRFGLPRIGAEVAAVIWAAISKIVDEELANEDVTLVGYALG